MTQMTQMEAGHRGVCVILPPRDCTDSKTVDVSILTEAEREALGHGEWQGLSPSELLIAALVW
jgi:hypothetical protein